MTPVAGRTRIILTKNRPFDRVTIPSKHQPECHDREAEAGRWRTRLMVEEADDVRESGPGLTEHRTRLFRPIGGMQGRFAGA